MAPELWLSKIFSVENPMQFEPLALEAFRFQYQQIEVYRNYCQTLKINPENVKKIHQIPFLPVEFFKTHRVIADDNLVETTFTSSGTTGMETSKHLVCSLNIYDQSFLKAFQYFYGPPSDYCILALLPSYLERKGSSLVYMANRLIQESGHHLSGFFLNNLNILASTLQELTREGKPFILLGVTYALLDLSEQFPIHMPNAIIMETGGMKGQRLELVKEAMHQQLKKAFGVKFIHSEYGMTELLSQGYSKGEGIFNTPPWMQVLIRDTYDPFSFLPAGRSGGINIIDLANIYSCCFIETKDIGKTHSDNSFSVLGRFDNSDIRGCNLMVG